SAREEEADDGREGDRPRAGGGLAGEASPVFGAVRRPEQNFDSGPQRIGRGMSFEVASKRGAQGTQASRLAGTLGAGSQVRSDLGARDGIELLVDMGGEPFSHLAMRKLGHATHPFACRTSARCARARARRDITVPAGTPVTSAISR